MRDDEEFLTIRQFANKVHYSERQIRQGCIDGKINASKAIGRKWLIPVTELYRFERNLGVEATKKSGAEIELQARGKIRDIEIFQKANEFLDESKFREIIEFLQNTCFRYSQMTRIERFLGFFDSESNQYFNPELRLASFEFGVKLRELFTFMEIYSVEYLWFRKHLGNKWDLFENRPGESDASYFKPNRIDEFYLLVPAPETYQFWAELKKEYDESSPRYMEWRLGLNSLVDGCATNYSKYRAAVRDNLAM